jgi:hypothetical protein
MESTRNSPNAERGMRTEGQARCWAQPQALAVPECLAAGSYGVLKQPLIDRGYPPDV